MSDTGSHTSNDPKVIFPETNFTSNYTVVLSHPLSVVFPILATSEGHDRVVRLSNLCLSSKLQNRDIVAIPRGTTLATSRVRTLPAADEREEAFSNVINLPRQHFTLTETVQFAFVLSKSVNIKGTLTWDETNRLALYESQAGGIQVWKLRKFSETNDGKTKVAETIEGHCPSWMKSIVQSQTKKAHRCVDLSSLTKLDV